MRSSKTVLAAMVLLSWITIPFLGRKSIKKFLPSTLFTSFILMIESYIGNKRKWWSFYTKLIPNVIGELPFILGPFLAGSLWVLKLTYGKFGLYAFLNAIFNLLFAYPLTLLFNKLNIYSLKRIRPFNFFLLMYKNAFLMYGFQKMIGNNKRNN